MRDPKRIRDILRRLEAVWTKNPDIRLGQLIMWGSNGEDPWNYECETIMRGIEKVIGAIQAGEATTWQKLTEGLASEPPAPSPEPSQE